MKQPLYSSYSKNKCIAQQYIAVLEDLFLQLLKFSCFTEQGLKWSSDYLQKTRRGTLT